jgi:ribosome-associated protein
VDRETQELEDQALLAECRVDTFRAGGPGGQHANVTDSGVRLTHLPSGITVISRKHRSQHRNRKEALALLKERLKARRRRPKRRIPTRVPSREKRRRLEAKKKRGTLKANRRKPRRGDDA